MPGSEHWIRGSQAVCYSMRASGILVGFFRPAAVLALAFVGEALSWLSWARVAATSALNSSTASCIRSPPSRRHHAKTLKNCDFGMCKRGVTMAGASPSWILTQQMQEN